MDQRELKLRTKNFALRIYKLVNALPNTIAGNDIAHQLFRAGTSVAANYRAACRGRSKAEFVAKMGTVAEEADESCFWMELVIEGDLLPAAQGQPLLDEADELTAIFTASTKTAKLGGAS